MTMVLNERGGEIAIAAGDAQASSVAWGAIIGGAVAAAAVSLLLMLLGSGLGLTVISPWNAANPSLTSIAATALIWLIVVHWVASAAGGYLAGRLRSGWTGMHRDEVMFRDTAHGFLAWGLATLLVVAIAGMATSAVLFSGVQAVSTVAAGAVQGGAQGAAQGVAQGASQGGAADPTAYFVDTLFRPGPGAAAAPTPAGAAPSTADVRGEVGRLLVRDIAADTFPADDRAYLGDLIASRTGVAPDVAKMRVDTVIKAMTDAKTAAKDTADKARKAAASAALGLVLALVIGAFVASAAAALGGHMRDDPTV